MLWRIIEEDGFNYNYEKYLIYEKTMRFLDDPDTANSLIDDIIR